MAIPRNLANIAPHVNASSTELVINDGGANLDFRVEGDTVSNLLFVDASAEAVGISTSSPDSISKLTIASSTGPAINFKNPSNNANGYISNFFDGDGNNIWLGSNFYQDSGANLQRGDTGKPSVAINLAGRTGSGFMRFFTGTGLATERARITSGGYFKASDSGTYTDVDAAFHEVRQSANNHAWYIGARNASQTLDACQISVDRNTTNNTYYALAYYNAGAAAYKFQVADSGNVTNTNNSYGSISDIKLKQDIVDAGSQWNDIKNLRVRKYRWKSDPDGFMQMGLVAQEAELVSPGLIDEHPDYEEVEVPVLDVEGNPVLNEDGTPQVTKERNALGTTTKAIKYSVLYMKAVKALQEAIERIETLEASNTALEARIAALEAQ